MPSQKVSYGTIEVRLLYQRSSQLVIGLGYTSANLYRLKRLHLLSGLTLVRFEWLG